MKKIRRLHTQVNERFLRITSVMRTVCLKGMWEPRSAHGGYLSRQTLQALKLARMDQLT
jgi:hypothetical protein